MWHGLVNANTNDTSCTIELRCDVWVIVAEDSPHRRNSHIKGAGTASKSRPRMFMGYVGCGHQKTKKVVLATGGIEPPTLALLAPRSNQLS